jgi:hypothetical protein
MEGMPIQHNTEKLHDSLKSVMTEYFPDDPEFFAEFDDEDLLGAVYGALLEIGEDPDEIFKKWGITEG